MLNIVIPMSGRGSRFSSVGYPDPKPLIPVGGQRMIELVIDNLTPRDVSHRFIFICLEEHLRAYEVSKILKNKAPDCQIIAINQVTEGAACSVLTAKEFIDSEDPLMIANSDQWLDASIDLYLQNIKGYAGGILTMPANDPKWSFVKKNDSGFVTEVVEKQVISDEATVGIYNFASGKSFVRAAETMIAKDIRVNGEFYVAPVYNILIREGAKIVTQNIGSSMWGLGTPEDLELFLRSGHVG